VASTDAPPAELLAAEGRGGPLTRMGGYADLRRYAGDLPQGLSRLALLHTAILLGDLDRAE
jgi:hypothetical protein